MQPGEFLVRREPILINKGRHTCKIKVVNRGDRPIFVGSHLHFYETDPTMDFNRDLAKGMRLNIPAGDAIQFKPGEEKTVELVEIGGRKEVYGFRGYVNGPVEAVESSTVSEKTISRIQYAARYGPTVGDKIHLADTDLVIEIEKDYTVYGDELKFGYGKTVRSGMGMSACATREEAIDQVLTNAIILDYWGIVKADIGIKDGKICGIGKAGNPDYMDAVDPNLVVGASTEVYSAEGLIVTAGGVDPHVHEICPQLAETALQGGITTLLGGGTGPNTGTYAVNSSPGAYNIHRMLEAAEGLPVNFGFWGKGNASFPQALEEQIMAGASGLKVHEDWGATPAVIDNALSVADQYDIQIALHTDSINESGHVESTIRAIGGRTVHTYHTEGTGGGHAPDIMEIASEPNVLPSSTDPTRPYTVNTPDEALEMIFDVHHLNKGVPTDVAMAQARVRPETQGAEGILHDLGVLSMMSSDSQAMGRIGEIVMRTWQTASLMKKKGGKLKEETGDNDNFRAKRYVAKYTINPAIAQGVSHVIGSLEVGKMADLVVWRPDFFGVKPEHIFKGGFIVHGVIGEANCSVPQAQPQIYKPMFGSFGKAPRSLSCTFMSKAAIECGVPQQLGLEKPIIAVRNTRNIGKRDMILNNATPRIVIDPETFNVKVDGEWIHNPPAEKVPMGQKYFIF